ncbi:MAG: MBL fold metallo-hydrolase [Candidatus Thorarchaeota archaeon]
MQIGEIEVVPLAAESLGVRSFCTLVKTPDLRLVLDPSAALAMRERLEPHPFEYQTLIKSLERIFVESRKADVLSISHYHYDHVRPGFTDFRYNLSSREELQRLFERKIVLAKDNRDNINPSQRRRGFYFEKDVQPTLDEIHWSDSKTFEFGATKVICSKPLSHGPSDTKLGYVIATTIEYEGVSVMFAPDLQGPVVHEDLTYILSSSPDLLLVGGPPLYLKKFEERHRQSAFQSLTRLVTEIPLVVVDHHLMRSKDWLNWLGPIKAAAERVGNQIMSIAELLGVENRCLESMRTSLYSEHPPHSEFLRWIDATDEYKKNNLPPLNWASNKSRTS